MEVSYLRDSEGRFSNARLAASFNPCQWFFNGSAPNCLHMAVLHYQGSSWIPRVVSWFETLTSSRLAGCFCFFSWSAHGGCGSASAVTRNSTSTPCTEYAAPVIGTKWRTIRPRSQRRSQKSASQRIPDGGGKKLGQRWDRCAACVEDISWWATSSPDFNLHSSTFAGEELREWFLAPNSSKICSIMRSRHYSPHPMRYTRKCLIGRLLLHCVPEVERLLYRITVWSSEGGTSHWLLGRKLLNKLGEMISKDTVSF